MRKESHHGRPLKEIIWFSLAIIGFFAAIALLTGYLQKARSMEKTSHRVEVMKFGSDKSAGGNSMSRVAWHERECGVSVFGVFLSP